MLIYKIFRAPEWAAFQAAGETAGAPIDLSDGYIHFSTAEQAPETAAKYFADEPEVVIAACDADTFGRDLKWERSRGGALFPHLYRHLRMEDVHSHVHVANGPDGPLLPEGILEVILPAGRAPRPPAQ